MTMPAQPALPAQTAPIAAPAPPPKSSMHERTLALKEKLEAEPVETSESAGDGAVLQPGTSIPPITPSPADSGAPVDPAILKAREERAARLAEFRAREQAEDVERQRQRERKERDGEAEKLRAKLADLEPLNAVFGSEESLLAEAERRGMSAEKLVQWMRTRLTDPAAVAARQTKTVEDKFREELAKERAAREALEQRLADQQQQAQEQTHAQQKAMSFLQKTQAATASHPLSAQLLARTGPHGFITFANEFIAPKLREDYSIDELHDHVEQLLDVMQLGGASPVAASPANGASQAPPKRNGVAEPATTLSNALAAERTSVTEELPLSRLPFKERERRLKEKLGRE